MPSTKGGNSSLPNALSLVAAWETWYIPRPQPVDPAIITNPSVWELDAHYLEGFEPHSFPTDKPIPLSMGKREGTLIGFLSPSKGNLWKLLRFTEELSTVNLDEVTWNPPTEFDPRFSYYSVETDLAASLSSEEVRETSEEKEVAKTSLYSMSEIPSLEVRINPEESELGTRGRKRGAEEDISAPPQKGKKGSSRRSSVPPGSDTARAREKPGQRSYKSKKERVLLKEPLRDWDSRP